MMHIMTYYTFCIKYKECKIHVYKHTHFGYTMLKTSAMYRYDATTLFARPKTCIQDHHIYIYLYIYKHAYVSVNIHIIITCPYLKILAHVKL